MTTRRRFLATATSALLLPKTATGGVAPRREGLRAAAEPLQPLQGPWSMFTDRVMGGISSATLDRVTVDGREAWRLLGSVRTENHGGFVQMAMDTREGGRAADWSAYEGLALTVRGNGESYAVHLRTPDLAYPWQLYTASFVAPPRWTTVRVPFEAFEPSRTSTPLDRGRVLRLGVVGIGRPFEADIAVADVALYRGGSDLSPR